MKRIKKRWIALLAIILVAGVLLALAIRNISEDESVLPIGSENYSYGTILITVLVIAIPILLIVLTLVIAFVKDKAPLSVDAANGGDTASNEDEESSESEEIGERFCMLGEIDKQKDSYGHTSYNKEISLEELCNRFRDYAASRLKLYYDIEDIRRFIAGMAVSHILILQGMSGTGKTSLAHAFGSFIDNRSTIIPVQPMWKERSDLIGYYNEFTKKFNETLLLEKMYEANYSEDMYITVLDEMNIARVEASATRSSRSW